MSDFGDDWRVRKARNSRSDDRQPTPGRVSATVNYGEGHAPIAGTAVPGRRSGTEHLPEGPNGARRESGRTTLAGPATRAEHPLDDAGEALPYLETIQRSFGRHSLSGVRARIGGGAEQACHDIGAVAFATRGHIAFARVPDLHTAAHEAAHVIQQRAGVVSATLDQPGDEHEQHADEVADAVVRGESAEHLLDLMTGRGAGASTSVVQRKTDTRARSTGRPDSGKTRSARLNKVDAPPVGTVIAIAQLDASVFVSDLRSQIAVGAKVSARVLVSGESVLLHLEANGAHWVASVTVDQLVTAIAGPGAMQELGSSIAFLRKLPELVTQTGSKLRVNLWGKAPNDSFAVLDLQHAFQGLETGSLAGFRPLEAQILLGKSGGVRVFGNDQVKADASVPGSPIGGEWFELPPDARLAAALGTDGGTTYGGVFYEHGLLRVAVKPTKDAQTGIVAHVDLLYIANKLKSLGQKAASWVAKLVDRIKNNVVDFLKMIGSKLHFELPDTPGIWFEFDFSIQLPRLFSGGHFDLSGLLPSGFSIDLGGLSLGALPSFHFPWLRGPSLGTFHVNWDRFRHILGSLSLPRLPGVDLGLHFKGDFTLGLGVDLGALVPDLGDFAIGFELDLEKLLSKVERGGKWLLEKMRKTGDWLRTHVHLGRDGVLRIYDAADPTGPMLGFHLLRLLDGADATDLAPTEIRYGASSSAASIEMGEVHDAKQDAAGEKPIAGKASPERPEGDVILRRMAMPAPASLARTLALAPGATVDVELLKQGSQLSVWSKAKSTVYAHEQALRTTVSMDAIAAAIARLDKLKPFHLNASDLPIELDLQNSLEGPRINFGRLIPSAVGVGAKAGKFSGFAIWKIEQLLGATDWTHLVPAIAQVSVDGVGGVQLGRLSPTGQLLGSYPFEAPEVRRTLLATDDGQTSVFGAIYRGPDLIEVAVAKDAGLTQGVLASIHPSALLSLLKKLGELGRRALERIADVALPRWKSGGKSDVWSHLAAIAQAVSEQFLKFVNGILSIRVGGIDMSWDLKLQLPRFRDHINLDGLIPDLHFDLPKLPGFNFSFAHGPGFRNPFQRLSFPKLRDLLPDIHIPSFELDVAWVEGFDLGLSLDLGDLFGDGPRSVQFRLPLRVILDKLKRLGDRIGKFLGKVGDKLDRLKGYCHLGADGILRLFDPNDPGTRVGFDLKKLLDGAQAEDLVPVELHTDVDVKGKNVAEVSYGDDQIDAKDKAEADEFAKHPKSDKLATPGKVLVPPPKGQVAARTTMKAPAWLTEYLGIAPTARVRASLYLDHADHKTDAVLFASVDGTDRGVELRVHVDQLLSLAGTLGPIKADVGVAIDVKATTAKGMLVVKFGKDKGAELHGHVGWRIDNLLADPSLASLVPDEIVAERKEGSLELSNSIDVSDLKQYESIPLSGLDWAKRALQSDHAIIFAATDLRKHPRVALTSDRRPDGTYSGVELKVDPKFVERMEAKAHHLAEQMMNAASKAFRRRPTEPRGRWNVDADAHGVKVSRGREGQADYIYAAYGWHHLAIMATGDVDLMPDDVRVGTQSMAMEMHALPAVSAPPASAHLIKSLHPFLRDPLLAVGLDENQRVEFDKKDSKVIGGTPSQVRAVANVWNADNTGRQLIVELDLEALLSHLLPHRRSWTKKEEVAKAKGSRVSASIGVTEDINHDQKTGDYGLELSAALHHTTKAGKHRDLELSVGWSLEQVLDILLGLQEDKDGGIKLSAGQLIPQHIRGSFQTDRFKITFGNDGKPTDFSCHVEDVPGLGALLGTVLDAETVHGATLNLGLPSAGEMKEKLKQALKLEMPYVPLLKCSIGVPTQVPGQQKYYEIEFAVTPVAFKKLLYLIPAAGEILAACDKLIDVISDPIGTAEAVVNTPEAIIDMVESFPEVYGNIKRMGLKRVAMGIVMGNHPTVRQFVLANRIKRKLMAAGWKPGQPKQKEWDEIPDSYLEWLSKQPPEALAAGAELEKLMEENHIPIEKDYKPIEGSIDPAAIRAQMDMIEHGFVELSDARDAEKNAANDVTRKIAASQTQKKAEKLREHLHEVLESGVKESKAADPDSGTTRDATVDDAAVNQLDQSKPSDKQLEEARSLFGSDDKDAHVVVGPEAEAWIQSFAGLTNEQLGELLVAGRTIIQTGAGKREVKVNGDAQKGFVRALLVKRMQAAGQKVTKTANKPTDDAKLVAAQRAQATRAEAASEAGGGFDEEGGLGGFDEDGEDSEELAEQVNGNGDGKGAAGSGDKAGGAAGHGGANDGKDGNASEPKAATDDKAAASTKDDGGATEEEWTGTVHDAVHLLPAVAAKLVDFKTGQLREEFITERNLRGFRMRYGMVLQDIKLASFKRSGGREPVYSFTLELDVDYKGMVSPTWHTYTYAPSRGDKAADEFHMEDAQGFIQKVRNAVVLEGNSGRPSGSPVVSHMHFSFTVQSVISVKADTRPSRNGEWDEVILEVKYEKVPDGGMTVTNSDREVQLVYQGQSARIALLLPRKAS